MKDDYQFDDSNQSLPVWKVKHQSVSDRNARMPFFKQTSYARAATRKDAIAKVAAYFSGHDKFSASKQ
jgi:hypothetical protein